MFLLMLLLVAVCGVVSCKSEIHHWSNATAVVLDVVSNRNVGMRTRC